MSISLKGRRMRRSRAGSITMKWLSECRQASLVTDLSDEPQHVLDSYGPDVKTPGTFAALLQARQKGVRSFSSTIRIGIITAVCRGRCQSCARRPIRLQRRWSEGAPNSAVCWMTRWLSGVVSLAAPHIVRARSARTSGAIIIRVVSVHGLQAAASRRDQCMERRTISATTRSRTVCTSTISMPL